MRFPEAEGPASAEMRSPEADGAAVDNPESDKPDAFKSGGNKYHKLKPD